MRWQVVVGDVEFVAVQFAGDTPSFADDVWVGRMMLRLELKSVGDCLRMAIE